LNPAELLRQSRDSNRVSDMATLTSAINLYTMDQSGASGFSLGSSSVVYISIPDPNATITGSNCSSLSLPTLPSTYSYHCAASSTYRNIDGTGWIPVNLTNLSSGSPLSNLSVDPTNTSSSHLYYTYTTNGSQFEVTSAMESAKYKLGGSNDQISGDGGPLATIYEKGSQLGLEPLDYGDSSLVGLWAMDEGSGTTAYDMSGSNRTGTWTGTQAGTNGYYSAGKVGPWGGYFNGGNDVVTTTQNNLPIGAAPRSFFTWVYYIGPSTGYLMYGLHAYGTGAVAYELSQLLIYATSVHPYLSFYWGPGGDISVSNLYLTQNVWHLVGYTYNGGTNLTIYDDGQSQVISLSSPLNTVLSPSAIIGSADGLLDDARFYNRALSTAEVQALYNGGK